MSIVIPLNDDLKYNPRTEKFNDVLSKDIVYRFLKGKYTTVGRLELNFLNKGQGLRDLTISAVAKQTFLDELIEMYDDIKPFSYKEAFELEDQTFRAKVFSTVDIGEMVENLGNKRLETAGKRVSRKQFDAEGNFLGMKEYDVVYETHKIYGGKLGLNNDIYAVKCWCTSTEDAHWIWIDRQYQNDPLAAIASTFRIAENLIPYIKELKRQGDILIVELTEEVEPKGNVVPLTPEQYFSLLTAES
jgi:hypothetical protein